MLNNKYIVNVKRVNTKLPVLIDSLIAGLNTNSNNKKDIDMDTDMSKFISKKISIVINDNNNISFIDTKVSDFLFVRCRGNKYIIFNNNILCRRGYIFNFPVLFIESMKTEYNDCIGAMDF